MARIDHTDCTHVSTPAARKLCRSFKAAAAAPVVEAPSYITQEINRQVANNAVKARMDRRYDDEELRITGPVARRMARQAMAAENARIQPRRSGARVSTTGSTCVQAALHIDSHGGRCACGWAALTA